MPRLFENDQLGKQESPVRCPHCATTAIIRNGNYQRAHPEEDRCIDIQRYLCKSRNCPRKTFSILPYPFLPIIRHFYDTILLYHYLYNKQRIGQAATAWHLNVTRGRAKRLGVFCRRFLPWLKHEEKISDWGADLQENAVSCWGDFTQDFSQAFYPGRCPATLPTQYIPSCF